MRTTLILALIIFFATSGTRIAHAREDLVPGSRFTSARAAAMADAFIPLGEDGATALFYNPALIGKFKKPTLTPLSLSTYVNGGYIAMADLNFFNLPNLAGYQSTLASHVGQYASGGMQIVPSFATNFFSAAILVQTEIGAIRNAGGTLRYRSNYQFIPAVGTGFRLADGILRFGYSLQYVNQALGNVTTANVTTPSYLNSIQQGAGFSHNAGAALTLPIAGLPQLDVVARNILGTAYTMSSLYAFSGSPSGSPTTEPMSFDASFSIQPKFGKGTYLNLVFEYRDFTGVSGVPPLGRAVLGLEFSIRDIFALRGGYKAGYPTAGIGFNTKNAEFSLTWYSEDIGASYYAERDSRLMLQYSLKAF